jgi:hypothetical protein
LRAFAVIHIDGGGEGSGETVLRESADDWIGRLSQRSAFGKATARQATTGTPTHTVSAHKKKGRTSRRAPKIATLQICWFDHFGQIERMIRKLSNLN